MPKSQQIQYQKLLPKEAFVFKSDLEELPIKGKDMFLINQNCFHPPPSTTNNPTKPRVAQQQVVV